MSVLHELINYRFMIGSLIRRDIRGRYKGSVLGFLWNFILPLVQILVFMIVFGAFFKNDIPNYPIYLVSGMVMWIWFSESITDASGVMVSNSELLKKIYFPRLVLPIVTVTSKMINFLIMIAITLVFMLVVGHPFTWNLLLLPVVIVITYVFILGISLFLSALDVFFRDVQYIVTALLFALIWLVPILYSTELLQNELLETLVRCNPLTCFVEMFHSLIYSGTTPSLGDFGMCAIIALIAFVIGYVVFRRLENYFAEVL